MVGGHKPGVSGKEIWCTQTRMQASERASGHKLGGWRDREKMGRTMGGEADVCEPEVSEKEVQCT